MRTPQTSLMVEGMRVALPRLASDSGAYDVIDRLSLSIDQGQTFALVGESGSGKSMTALALLRLLPEGLRIREGKVLMGDDDLFALRESDMLRVRGRRIGMIFQEPSTSLNPVMTIGQQLLEVIERHGLARAAAARELALEWFARVGLPEPERQLHAYPFELSGGQKQRAMIAIALAAQPELLIADEPTTALDVSLQAQIMALLKQLQQERGMAMLLITHDLALVSDVADHLALMYAGQIVESRASRDFFAEPRHPYGRLLLRALPKASDRGRALAAIEGLVPSLRQTFAGCRFASRCPWVLESCMHQLPTLNAERGVRCFRDAELAASGDRLRLETFDNRPSKSGTKLLEVRGLAVRYRRSGGWFEAVGGVDLELRRGETLALVGESGCGKTTIGKALMGLLPEDAKLEGQALFSEDGLSLIPRDQRRRLQIQSRMQMIFQDPFASLNPRMRIQQVLEEGILALRQSLQAQERSEAIRLLLEQVGLEPEVLNRYPHEFSGGQRQRIAIARALAVEPSLLICDEPTSALDVSVQAQILNLLVRLRDRLGLSLIFITHNIGVVEYLADHVAVMHQGRILEQGRADEVLEHPRQDYTRSLLASVPRLQR
ncbi:MAG: ABC transporter ATP-binding protein [Betaproteobacteria bacterium]|nr:ABC transporter ATP-binding protein [Betaproteobacteria bacterium]